jgi:hypothetical protein
VNASVIVLDRKGRWIVAGEDLSPTTGADGTQDLRLATGKYTILVQALGFAQTATTVTVSEDRELPVSLSMGGTVSVVVTGAEGTIAGAEVRVFGPDGREIAEYVTERSMMTGAPSRDTGEDGTLLLANQPAGTLRVTARANDGRKAEGTVRVTEGGRAEIALQVK